MSVTEQEIEAARDLFSGVGPLSTRKMFGGLGIYADGTIFALLMSDGRTLIKGAGAMITRFDDMGMVRWTYQRPGGKEVAMPYWELPDSALDDPEEASSLARQALAHL